MNPLTIRRWCQAGRLAARHRGGFWFPPDVLARLAAHDRAVVVGGLYFARQRPHPAMAE